MKIAVFTRDQREFEKLLRLRPSNMFIRILDERTLMGCKFAGIIEVDGWWDFNGNPNKKLCQAFDLLKERQPELFYN
jgi:hypothetical protein